MDYAPIILFVYNRPWHTQQTIRALLRNDLAAKSDLFIFADGAKDGASEEQINRVQQVRDYISTIDGFKSVHIEQSGKNKGLANSILYGVTKIVNQYGSVIVLEDDIVTSSHFLEYMNHSLNLYKDDVEVICLNSYSIVKNAPIIDHTYFQFGADCQGWATWKRGWELFNPNAQYLQNILLRNRKLRKLFTYNNTYPYMEMLQDQIDGKIDSWAIRWYAAAVINKKLCLYPSKSLVKNIGFNEGATHTSNSSAYEASIEADETTNDFPRIVVQDSKIMRRELERLYKKLYQKKQVSLQTIIKRKIKNVLSRLR